MLRVGYYSIYNKIRYGDLEAHQIGRKWLITPQAVLEYLNRRGNKENREQVKPE
jgi:excisionase family DNA binding protein